MSSVNTQQHQAFSQSFGSVAGQKRRAPIEVHEQDRDESLIVTASSACFQCRVGKRKCDKQRPCSRCTSIGRAAHCRTATDEENAPHVESRRKKQKTSNTTRAKLETKQNRYCTALHCTALICFLSVLTDGEICRMALLCSPTGMRVVPALAAHLDSAITDSSLPVKPM